MATPSIRQVLGDSSSGAASVSTTSQTAVDDLLIVIHQTAWRDDADLTEPTGTTGIDGWVSFEQESSGNFDADVYMRCWRARVTTAGSKFIEIDPAEDNHTNSIIVLVLSEVDHNDPIDGTTSNANEGGTSFPVGGITTTGEDSLLVGSWAIYGNDGLDAPGSMIEREEHSRSINNTHMCATQALTSSGSTGSRTATTDDGVVGWTAVLFAVRGGGQTITPTSIPTGESFGTPTVSQPSNQTITPTSIPTAESVPSDLFIGAATPQTITFDVGEGAIASEEAFGEPTLSTTIDPRRQQRRTRRTPNTYELVCMARVPQSSGPPVLLTVEGLTWSEINYVDELSEAQTFEARCLIDTLPESVVQRFNTLAENATELWLYRDGRLVFAGPLVGWSVADDDEVVLNARGLLYYLRYWAVTSDLSWENTDQFTIVKDLVDHWQDQTYGHYGIDTSGIGASGVTRTVEYKRDELHSIASRVTELAEGAFDVEVNPATRALQLWAPQKGVDRSSGPDAIVFDDRNVTDSNMISSVAPGDIASEALGTGTTSGEADKVYATASNEELRATWGRTAYTQTFDETAEASALAAKLDAALDERSSALLVPGPDVRNVADADLADYAEGDIVDYQLHERLGIRGAFRIRRRRVRVNDSGQELITLEFV